MLYKDNYLEKRKEKRGRERERERNEISSVQVSIN
jgi:hypothetical protein